jgi:alkanesulfonate monooxygenase SsuD/methylene tetrahydromethanopterin reductase-like flavin-dependent oxidoreductase (luciferase family)
MVGAETLEQRNARHEIRRDDVVYGICDTPSELAVALEERGFESLWASEHSHLPVVEGEGLPKVQADAMDPFLTLTAAAMSTKTLKLGHRHLPR